MGQVIQLHRIKAIQVILKGVDDSSLLTELAYNVYRLQMSTGDFHTHTSKVVYVDDYTGMYDFDPELNDFVEL